LQPEELKYALTLAYYLNEKGDGDEAIVVLKKAIVANPPFFDGCDMLAGIYESRGERKTAAQVLRNALRQPRVPPQLRTEWEARAAALEK
jgi:Tfp pilus assembly protein PilF